MKNELNNENEENDEPRDFDELKIGHRENNIYVLIAIERLMGGSESINLIARGVAISKAISVALIIKNKYLKNVKFNTTINSVLFENIYIPTIKIKIINVLNNEGE